MFKSLKINAKKQVNQELSKTKQGGNIGLNRVEIGTETTFRYSF